MSIQGRKTFDKDRISVNLARLRKGGEDFEIVVDPDKAVAFKEGAGVDIRDILKAPDIFSDAKKGEHAPESRFEELFGTKNKEEIAKKIIEDGEIQLTAEHRQKVRNQKRKQLLQIIHRNGVDPKTKLPHPITRLENAFEEAKVRIDEFRSAEDQLKDVLDKLRPVLAVKFEVAEIALKIPAEHAARSYSTVKNHSTIRREEWQNDGSWVALVELPAGMRTEFIDKLNKLTSGNVEVKLMESK